MFSRMMNSFYYGKSGKGDFTKDDLPTNRWQLFWSMLRVRLSGLFRLNLMTVLVWLPVILIIGSAVGQVYSTAVYVSEYQNYVETGEKNDLTDEQIATFAEMENPDGIVSEIFYYSLSRALLWLIPAILITGPVKAGQAYVTRNWARDEHAFIWGDFKDAVKENWKQALGVSAITSIIPIMVYICFQFYGQMANQQGWFFVIPQMLIVMLALIWVLALTFMYPVMVTYKVNFKTLIKNSAILAVARLPMTVGIRLVVLVPMVIGLAAAFLTGSMIAPLCIAAYYLLFGYAFTRFVFASYTNSVFDKFINPHIEGVKINRGLAQEDDDDEEEDNTELQ